MLLEKRALFLNSHGYALGLTFFNFSFPLILINLNFKIVENKEKTHFTRVCKVYFAVPMFHAMVLSA